MRNNLKYGALQYQTNQRSFSVNANFNYFKINYLCECVSSK